MLGEGRGQEENRTEKKRTLKRHYGPLEERHLPTALQAGGISLSLKDASLGVQGVGSVSSLMFSQEEGGKERDRDGT